MSGPLRPSPGVATQGEDAQESEIATPLPWQGELDSAIADIDSRLSHPRRRATDVQPTLPDLGQQGITSEMIDEIAWRVSERLRQDGVAAAPGATVIDAIAQAVSPQRSEHRPAARSPQAAATRPAALPPLPAPRALPHGIALTIRIRKPLFRFWPFRRRRRQSMMMFSDYRV